MLWVYWCFFQIDSVIAQKLNTLHCPSHYFTKKLQYAWHLSGVRVWRRLSKDARRPWPSWCALLRGRWYSSRRFNFVTGWIPPFPFYNSRKMSQNLYSCTILGTAHLASIFNVVFDVHRCYKSSPTHIRLRCGKCVCTVVRWSTSSPTTSDGICSWGVCTYMRGYVDSTKDDQ